MFRLHCTHRRVILPLHVPTVKSGVTLPQRLTVVHPPEVGAALARAVSRLTAAPLQLSVRELPRVSAHLACGDFESIRARIRTAAPDPALPLALARYVSWTGDLQGAAAIWPIVLSALEDVLAANGDAVLRQRTAAALQGPATDLGETALAARLHRYAREHVASSAPEHVDPDVKVICDVAHVLLGIDPDAARGRLRLRPRLGERDLLDARHVRFADGSVSIRAVRTAAALEYRVEQVEGSIPLTLLLEPFVDDPIRAEVDGHTAELVPQSVEGGVIVPVQLVLDDVRTLIVHTAQ